MAANFYSSANAVTDAVLGGWQISAINTAQAGTPFNVTYSPNGAQAVSPQISATYRGANEYRPDYVQPAEFQLAAGKSQAPSSRASFSSV
jgi:hypothetical protein